MFLYTEDKYSEDDIENLAKEGILPLYLVNKSDKSEGYNQANLSANLLINKIERRSNLILLPHQTNRFIGRIKYPKQEAIIFTSLQKGIQA
jgi:hypothetical protein